MEIVRSSVQRQSLRGMTGLIPHSEVSRMLAIVTLNDEKEVVMNGQHLAHFSFVD